MAAPSEHFSWSGTPRLADQLIAEAGNHPSEAALALARAVARTLDPPPPEPQVRQLDRYGLLLETVLAILILTLRGLLMTGIAAHLLQIARFVDVPFILRQIALPDLACLDWSTAPDWRMALAYLSATCWFAVESHLVPSCLEFMRSLPCRWMHARQYMHWRTDALHSLCGVHVISVQLFLLYRVAAESLDTIGRFPFDLDAGYWQLFCTLFSVFTTVAGISAWSRSFEH